MKKILLIFVMVLIIGALSAQTSNSFKYVIKAKGGITNTLKGLDADKIDSTKVSGDSYYTFQGADTLIPHIPSAGYDDIYDYVTRKYADTLLVTTVEFRPVIADAGKIIRCNHATQTKVFLPPDSTANFPLGSVLNFSMDNAGIVTFYESNSVITSKNDSASINVQYGWATAIKRAANKWDLLGDLQD